MIDKRASYSDKNFAKHLKGLGLSEEEIKYILGETKRKKFEDGGDSGGDSGGESGGESASSGEGESTGDASDQGGTEGPGTDAGQGPGDTFGSSTADDAASNQAASEAAAQAASDEATLGMQQSPATEETGIMSSLTNFGRQAFQNAINNPVSTMIGMAFGPVAGLAARGIAAAVDAANRGVTGPNDHSQETASVQSNTQSTSGDGGIATIQQYAPAYNPDTGNPTMDAYMRQLRVNLGLPV